MMHTKENIMKLKPQKNNWSGRESKSAFIEHMEPFLLELRNCLRTKPKTNLKYQALIYRAKKFNLAPTIKSILIVPLETH